MAIRLSDIRPKTGKKHKKCKFDDYPGFQPMRSWANTYAQDCKNIKVLKGN
jgi:hypothetical protein